MLKKTDFYKLIPILLFFLTFVMSCDKRPAGVLNSKKMENLLVDLHILDGSLRVSGKSNSPEEMQKYYDALFQKYGINQTQFDSCLSWYTKHPQKFDRIYLNVSARIDTLNSQVMKRKFHPLDSAAFSETMNVWNKPIKYVFTKDSARTSFPFEIKGYEFLPEDVYELSFLQRIAPSDSSVNHHAVLYVNYLNGVVDSIYIKTRNDNVLRKYMLHFKARKPFKIKSISGELLGYNKAKGKMNATLDSIKLMRKFNPFKQDSIRKAVYKTDTTKIHPASTKNHIPINSKKLLRKPMKVE